MGSVSPKHLSSTGYPPSWDEFELSRAPPATHRRFPPKVLPFPITVASAAHNQQTCPLILSLPYEMLSAVFKKKRGQLCHGTGQPSPWLFLSQSREVGVGNGTTGRFITETSDRRNEGRRPLYGVSWLSGQKYPQQRLPALP